MKLSLRYRKRVEHETLNNIPFRVTQVELSKGTPVKKNKTLFNTRKPIIELGHLDGIGSKIEHLSSI